VIFFLGTHMPNWLAELDVPLFVSHRRLARHKRLPVARAAWALDSGGFTELKMHGLWATEPAEYINACRRYMTEIGQLAWAAPMDWMCEPEMLRRTGLTVDRHQALTIENLVHLRQEAPDVPFIPVLQGWKINDYLACIDRYADAGIDLTAEPVVGVGSVCRRQSTGEIAVLFSELAYAGIRCHGFGVKTEGAGVYAAYLASADSMAWSYNARKNPPMEGCAHGVEGTGSCANCPRWALRWRERLLQQIAAAGPVPREVSWQPDLWEAA
jgi:hypothetical protein